MSDLIKYLIDRWPDRFGETPAQRAENMKTGQRPPGVSDEEWHSRGIYDRYPRKYFDYCHWYDRAPDIRYGRFGLGRESQGYCNGQWHHDHQSQIMRWYWAGPAVILSPLGLAWEARGFILSGWLERLGWYRLLERFGVDTSPR